MTLCHICGEAAEKYFAHNPLLPLCANVVCEQATVDEINILLGNPVDPVPEEK